VIKRIWHGCTRPEDADTYEALLREEILPGIADRGIQGYLGIELLRRRLPDEVEFVTIMTFDSMDAVARFAGPDPGAAYVPPKARALLARFDERPGHFEVRPV